MGETFHLWAGLRPISTSRPGIADEGTVKTQVSPPSTVVALGKFAANHYSVSGTSFKKILKMNQFRWDFGLKWNCVRIDAKVMIWVPTKGRL